MSPVGLAHFIELTVLVILFIVTIVVFYKWIYHESADVWWHVTPDDSDKAQFLALGIVAALFVVIIVRVIAQLFMHMVFPDYTYWLIGA